MAARYELAAEGFDERALAHAGGAGDAYAPGFAGVRQQFAQELLGGGLMAGLAAFHQRNRPGQHGAVARQHPGGQFGRRRGA